MIDRLHTHLQKTGLLPEGASIVVTEWDREKNEIYVSSLSSLMKGK